MRFSRILCPILAALALASCDSENTATGATSPSTSSSTPSASTSGTGFEGTWLYRESADEHDLMVFKGSQLRHESFLKGCQISLTEGTWTLQGQYLMVTPTTVWTRSYDPDAKDSAAVCAVGPSLVTVTGTLPRELANVTASSFDLKTRKISFTDSGSTVTVILEHFVRQ